MPLIKNPDKSKWDELARRPVVENALLEKTVKKILAKVKAQGDKALKKITKELDGVKLKKIAVTDKEIKAAASLMPEELKEAIQQAKANIEKFHSRQTEGNNEIEIIPGIKCWRKSVGIEKVGIYIPGGSAPLFSTVLMLGVPAQIAGCREIVLCTPPLKDGNIHPAILYTATLCGIKNIFKVGGSQAIAAMAYGTETIPKVFKIFGPGNQYVTCAKQLVQLENVAIDMPAGPSELLVIADDKAIPEFVAADLLSQAEHGTDSQVIVATTSESIAEKVQYSIKEQLKELPRKKIATQALKNSKIILFQNLRDAIEFSNLYAPEHLIIACENANELSGQVISAGSVFIGNYSPESAGDYASGTNHTLPTTGYAAMYSGVSVDSFVKKISFQALSQSGLQHIGKSVELMAEAEGLQAHANAISIRLKK
ncbi:MAG: histidinol dehydrogenase [Bacteroidetes bacterium]|nr:histidinol dehydrogenase [Bacteroidota bacterium]MBS1931893.1 histidinol dehydrogenase [Bacteroidota bacterium]